MTKYALTILILLYLGMLFLIAYYVEKKYKKAASSSPLVYVLGLATYCSAWTYYGSIGMATTQGINFLTIYIGPVIAVPLWIVTLRKIISISKSNNISSIADFIALRYGNSRSLGLLITSICTIAIIPYISLQLKAVSESFALVSNDNTSGEHLFQDSAFYLSLVIGMFTAFFGTRSSDATHNRTGMLFTVAVESVIKLVIFLAIGIYVTYFMYDGTTDIYEIAKSSIDLSNHFGINSLASGLNWSFMIVVSFMMIFLLPRQFHLTVVEYAQKSHLKHAIWGFPLYLLLFNIFVIFIAWAGRISLPENANPDYYTILLPLSDGNVTMATLVFFGGLSAAVSMIVISSLALSTMISNNVIIPYGILSRFGKDTSERNNEFIKNIRRGVILLLVLMAYTLFVSIRNDQSLFSLGLISFIIVAQLAPSFFIGMYWNRGTSLGAKVGIVGGYLVTVFTYIVPFIYSSVFNNNSIMEQGYFGWDILRPDNMLAVSDITATTTTFFWSIFVNTGLYLTLSVMVKGNYRERNYGEIYVNSGDYDALQESAYIWQGEAYFKDISELLIRFLGEEKAKKRIDHFRTKYNIHPDEKLADARFVNYSEKLLSSILGNVSAKKLIANVVNEKPLSLVDVLDVLEENKIAIATNKKLKKKSKELEELTDRLTEANIKLQELDRKKDTFLNTVAHELKTPVTSIGISSDVLLDEDMPQELRSRFLKNIQTDTDRLSSLIGNILDLEKLASGREKLNLSHLSLDHTLKKAIEGIRIIAQKKGINIQEEIDDNLHFKHDYTKFYQVFTNILSNALKFVKDNEGKITIRAKNLDNDIVIEFIDNGVGVDPVDLPFIFDKFYQSKNQDLKKPIGSGFGLAIVKTIVEMHGGQITASNGNHKGAVFTIKLTKYEKSTHY